MKIPILITIIVFCLHCYGQNEINDSLSILDYTCLEENKENEYYLQFRKTDSLSFWYNHQSYQKINDTLFFIILSDKEDKLLIYNFKTYKTNEVLLHALPTYPIDHIYYHNHDSIFIFYKRPYVFKNTDNTFDFVLVNGKGALVDTYSLNNVPYIDKGNNYNTIEYNIIDQICENRLFDNNLLITFTFYTPNVDKEEFIKFHPKQLALYNLSTKTIKMLNVKFPSKDFGKRYDKACLPFFYSLSLDKDHNIIINFSYSNLLYRYHFETDTLIQINSKYDNTFLNIDSTAWQEGHDYTSVMYKKVFWDSKKKLYFRSIELLSYKDYLGQFILQVMDSNFNHIAYLLNKDDYNTPYYNKYSDLVAYNEVNDLPYTIQLGNKIKQLSWEEFERVYLTKKDEGIGKTINFEEYFTRLQMPKNSLIVIINLSYPCGHCLKYLFEKMKENQSDYEKANVYYIIYDSENNGFSKTLMEKYKLTESTHIRVDHSLLQNVRLLGESVLDYKYRLIVNQQVDKVIKVKACTFEELAHWFEIFVTKKINNEEI